MLGILTGYLTSVSLKTRKNKYLLFGLSVLSTILLYLGRYLRDSIGIIFYIIGGLLLLVCVGLTAGAGIDIIISGILSMDNDKTK
jgi:hypothetical protein